MRYVVALDIGGTKIEAVLFDERLRIIRRERFLIPKKKGEDEVKLPRKPLLDLIFNIIIEISEGYRISGIGVGVPDVVSVDGRLMSQTRLVSLKDFNLQEFLSKSFGCRAVIANDADCFALAEQRMGAGKGHRNILGVIYGTGIGSGIVIDGKMFRAEHNTAAELGHNVLNPLGPKDRFGFPGTVESYVGGPKLVENYLKAGGKIKDPDPRKIFRSREKAAKVTMDTALEYLAISLASAMNLLSPSIIVMGGGQSNLPIYSRLNRLTKKYTLPSLRSQVRIVKNRLGDSAGVYGAAALVLDRD